MTRSTLTTEDIWNISGTIRQIAVRLEGMAEMSSSEAEAARWRREATAYRALAQRTMAARQRLTKS